MQRYPRDNTRQIQEIKLQQNKTKKTLKMISCRVIPKVSQRYLPTLYRNSPKFSHELWHFTPQVQKRHDYAIKRTRKSIKIQFLFSNRG